MSRYAFENLFREPIELYGGVLLLIIGLFLYLFPTLFLLLGVTKWVALALVLGLALKHIASGLRVFRFKRRLLQMNAFSMSTQALPANRHQLYLGEGFQWQPIHRQRLHLLNQLDNQGYLQPSKLYQWIDTAARRHPEGRLNQWRTLPLSPFKPLPDIGGKPSLHGVGSDTEQPVYLHQHNRNSHMVVFGMTRVGKTRLMCNIVAQDIRNGEAVLIIDPKSDLELLQDIVAACKVAGREKDLMILHAGMPEFSAKYNPLNNFVNISEIATRVTGAISAEGEGQQFKDFAWKFLNIVSTCLMEMGEPISYATLAFYVTRPKQLLYQYGEKMFPMKDPRYQEKIEQILAENSNKIDKKGNKKGDMTQQEAVQVYVENYIQETLERGDRSIYDAIIVDLHYAANLGEEYYSKITASLGPVFDKINKTSAREVFSWEGESTLPVIRLEEVIRDKKVVYMGLDALSNEAMAKAISQALIADLVTLIGKLYKTAPDKKFPLCLHVDEFSNMVRDEFINLLNKAGGAGIKVAAYTQTVNDLGAVFGTNKDKPKMLLGNFGTMIMLRVANDDTAEVFVNCLERTQTRSAVPYTTTSDKPDAQDGDFFTTQNTDSVSEEYQSIIEVNHLFSLPKGQAFVLTDGGKLYKIRIPLPEAQKDLPNSFEEILKQINRKTVIDSHEEVKL
ncbi:MAG: conjugative transfer system coupling protein TraD [Gammaproteobacteria bacterium]|nr:conjugative transfer system coupling protein TraD [Gammaproteobacteria bacterium]